MRKVLCKLGIHEYKKELSKIQGLEYMPNGKPLSIVVNVCKICRKKQKVFKIFSGWKKELE